MVENQRHVLRLKIKTVTIALTVVALLNVVSKSFFLTVDGFQFGSSSKFIPWGGLCAGDMTCGQLVSPTSRSSPSLSTGESTKSAKARMPTLENISDANNRLSAATSPTPLNAVPEDKDASWGVSTLDFGIGGRCSRRGSSSDELNDDTLYKAFSASRSKSFKRLRPRQSALNSARRRLIGGNWKCNGTTESVTQLIQTLNDELKFTDNVEVVVAPTALHTQYVQERLRPDIQIASQNVALSDKMGAFTGEISSDMWKNFGVDWSIIGHSERRKGFGGPGEDNDICARKTLVAIQKGLKVIFCIGESLEERESGNTMVVLSKQLKSLSSILSEENWSSIVLAYEPVWAIGTGKTATSEVAQRTHKDIRDWVSNEVSPQIADRLRIIYGGSVKGDNAKDLFKGNDIDGFLVGGASISRDFVAIVSAAESVAI